MTPFSKTTVIAPLALGVLLSLNACTDGTKTTTNDRALVSNYASLPAPTTTTPATMGTAMEAATASKPVAVAKKDSATAKPVLSDHQIASVIHVANEAEIGVGALAKTRAENPQVRAFARQMIDEHKKNNSEESAFTRNWDASSSENETSKNILVGTKAKLAELEKISGSDFDQAYMQNQMTMHKQLLDDLDNRFIPAAKDEKLRAFLKETRKHVSSHLTAAQELASMLER